MLKNKAKNTGAGKDPVAKPPSYKCLAPCFDQIPAILIAILHWVVWKAVWDPARGCYTKPPFRLDGYRASHSNPRDWVSFVRACAAYGCGCWNGIGFVLTAEDGLTGLDFDHVVNPKTRRIAAWAARLIALLDSYWEYSPSGTGIRCFIQGRIPDRYLSGGRTGRKRGGLGKDGKAALEAYHSNRFLTVTGQQPRRAPRGIERRQRVLNAIMAEIFPIAPVTPVLSRPSRQPLLITDNAVIEIAATARNGDKFCALYFDGDLSMHDQDASRVDLALMHYLLFYTGGNAEQAERLFTSSALGQREKWTTRADYREMTITKALSDMTDFFGGM